MSGTLAKFQAALGDKAIEVDNRLKQARQRFVETANYDSIVAGIDEIISVLIRSGLTRSPGKRAQEGKALAVVGESGSGKTTLVRRALETHPAFEGFGTKAGCPHLVSISVRAPATLGGLGKTLLSALGYHSGASKRDAFEVWEQVRHQIKMQDVRMIHIDEMHGLTQVVNSLEAQKISETFRSLLNSPDHPIGLIFAGTQDMLPALFDARGQLARRTRVVQVMPLQERLDGDLVKATIKVLTDDTNISMDKSLSHITARLMHASRYQIGLVIEAVLGALEIAIRNDEDVLCKHHFVEFYGAQSGSSDANNPFVARDWREIDTYNPAMMDEDDLMTEAGQ